MAIGEVEEDGSPIGLTFFSQLWKNFEDSEKVKSSPFPGRKGWNRNPSFESKINTNPLNKKSL